jgi:hypothetical protein
MKEEEPAMPTGYWKKDGEPQKKDEATKDVEGHKRGDDVEGHGYRNSDDDVEGHKRGDDVEGHGYRNSDDDVEGHKRDDDVEGHSFVMDSEMSRTLSRQREKDIQRNLRSESKRPFFRRGR